MMFLKWTVNKNYKFKDITQLTMSLYDYIKL